MMNDKRTIERLLQGLVAFEKVVDTEIHYVYFKEGSYYELIFKPQKSNFMHLCGVEYKNPKSKQPMRPSQFYSALKARKISPEGILKTTFTDQKLQVISCLDDLTKCTVRIIDDRTVYLNLSFDKGIRSKKQIFCLALVRRHNDLYAPNSLLNLKSSKGNTIKNGYPVHCIYKVDPHSLGKIILCQTDEFDEKVYFD
ncbi:PBECR4 domain-containing protein [Sporosarcina sp. FSL K6-3457]|uniref:PBECR4 domain-containing protein n=1 Tax=Sporosarcina sp. FSL K6-3457 TaxID=2978204 RepID=UPI0030F4FF08